MNTGYFKRALFILGFILSSLLACCIYWSGLHGPFVFDDLSNIILVPELRITQLNFESLYHAAFWQKSSGIGRPIAMLTFALNYYFSQFDIFYFKLTNLVIHLCNGALLYWLGQRLLQRLNSVSERDALTQQHIRWTGLAIAALWLVHPLNLTSVLYVVQRETSLASFFVLLGLIGYVQGREQLLNAKRRGYILILASLTVCGGLATFTKENGVLLPLYMFVIEIVFYRFAMAPDQKNRLIILWIMIFTLPALLLAGLASVKPSSLAALLDYRPRNFDMVDRLLTEARALWFYLRLIAIPNIREMGVYHDDFVISRSLLEPPTTLLAVAGILGLFTAAVFSLRRLPVAAFAIAWFFAGHALESSIFPLEIVHEHRNYLPQYGILFGIVYYLTYPYKHLAKSLTLRRGMLILYLLLCAGITYARAQDWKDEWTLYTQDVKNHPNSARAHTILGVILQDNKQFALAGGHFIKAVELEPTDSQAIIRLAQHYYGSTRVIPEPVLRQLEYGLMHYPYSGVTVWTYGPLLNDTLKDKELNLRLIHIYENFVLRKDLYLGDDWREAAFQTLGFTYRARTDYASAAYYFDKALALNPLPRYYLILAGIYKEQKNLKAAKQMLDHVKGRYATLSEDDKTSFDILKNEIYSTPATLKAK
jgi:tetratricopeptide (TPR) repeat protein